MTKTETIEVVAVLTNTIEVLVDRAGYMDGTDSLITEIKNKISDYVKML